MGTKEQVRQGFINLRAGVGLTAAKLEAEPLLMELLHADDGDQGVKLLTILCEALGGEDHGVALRSALAIGYPAGQGLKWRRQQLIQPHPGRSPELPVSVSAEASMARHAPKPAGNSSKHRLKHTRGYFLRTGHGS